jgi:2-oxoglutarate ferredoxin oxidoreductase subunit gamma
MYEDLLIAGFGGQGIIFAGKLLAYAGLREGKEVVYFPSYGAEMRGGTANCTVIISTSPIASPIISSPLNAIIMSHPSFLKFFPRVKKGGRVILNASLVRDELKRDDIKIVKVPANEIAENLGNPRVANMVILGAWVGKSRVVSVDSLRESLKEVLSKDKMNLLSLNEQALREGEKFASGAN